jgi:hypothetical protein
MSYGELINGELPLLLNDLYTVIGCPFMMGRSDQFLSEREWVSGSTRRLVNGVPVLLNVSVGFCKNVFGGVQGPALILSHQLSETEEGSIDSIIQRQIDAAKQAAAAG